MGLADFSIKQRRFVNILSIFLVIAGIYACFHMHREVFPNVQMDIVIVRADYPGTSPEQIERLIIQPIEKELRTVSDIKEMASVAVEHLGLTILELEPNAPKKARVVNDIQRAVDRVTDLPADLPRRPVVKELQTRNNPIIEVALSGNMPEEELQRQAKALETRLLEIDDIATINRKGWRDRQIWVEVDPAKMVRYELSLAQISAQLARHNVNISGGLLTTGEGDLLIRTSGEFTTPEEIGNVVLRTAESGRPVFVKDVASVHWDFAESATLQRVAGSRAIALVAVKKADGDAMKLVDEVRRTAEGFGKTGPPELKISYLNDMSFFIRRRLKVLTWNGLIGLGLVMATILYFLSFRTAAGAVIGIPIAALSALAIMYWAGASVNLITLFGMIMVIGMLVDEDLVIAENIHRYLESHDDPAHAVVAGTREIAKSVIATVLTTVAAFLPLLFIAGMIGKFMRWIPLVVIIALLSSLIEALCILPAHLHDLCTMFRKRAVVASREWRWFSAVRAAYIRRLEWCLKHRYLTVCTGVIIAVASIVATVKLIPFTLFPSRGLEIFFIRAETPIATPLTETETRFKQLEGIVMALPISELDAVSTQIGISQNDPDDPYTSRGSHIGQVAVYLTPPSGRRPMEEIMESIRPAVMAATGFSKIRLEKVRHGPPVGKPVSVRIKGNDFALLDGIASELKDGLNLIDGVTDVIDDYEAGRPEIDIVADPVLSARAGVGIAAIGRAVRAAFEGEIATKIRHDGDEYDVIVRLPADKRNDLKSLSAVRVPNASGNLVPLLEVAGSGTQDGPTVIKHINGRRAVTVSAEVDERVTTAVETRGKIGPAIKKLSAEHPDVSFEFAGEVAKTAESLHSLKIALILAVLLILAILLATLDSYGDALVVLTTIPLGLVGVTAGFLIMGYPFTFMALLGVVGLAGIVVDSAIILIDFVRRRQKTGIPLDKAMLESAHVRFRPIVLVTATTVFGVIPSAFGIGGTDPFIQPMALAMNWGLSVSTLLNLFWVPCLAMVMDDIKGKVSSRYSRGIFR